MKRIVLAFVALVSVGIFTAQSGVPILGSVGGGSASAPTYGTASSFANGSSVFTTGAMSISPTSGQQLWAMVETNGTATAIACTDSGSNSLTAGAAVTGANPFIYTFYETAGSGITSVTCTWTTTARNFTGVAGTVSGVGSVSTSNTAITATGSGTTTASISTVSTHTQDLMLSACGVNASRTWTSSTGTLQTSSSGLNPTLSIITNGSGGTSGSGVTNAAVYSSASTTWTCVSMEFLHP